MEMTSEEINVFFYKQKVQQLQKENNWQFKTL